MPRIEFDTSSSARYCSTSDVARFFEQYDSFGTGTTPTKSEVQDLIDYWMEYVDRETGHAWRRNTVKEEYKDFDGPYRWWSGRPVNLSKRDVADLSSSDGDKLEEWTGSKWNDWLTDSNKTEGRDNDYWMDNQNGILYIKRRFVFARHPQFRVTYRYGNPNGATKAIRDATAKLVAQDLLLSDQYTFTVPGTEGSVTPEEAANRWKEQADETIAERREVGYAEPF